MITFWHRTHSQVIGSYFEPIILETLCGTIAGVMLGFPDSFLPWTAATLIPAFIGLLIIVLAGNILKAKHLAAFAIGIFLWFFVDTIGGAASLDVNSGFNGGGGQIALSGLFAIGLLIMFTLDRNRNLLFPQLAIG